MFRSKCMTAPVISYVPFDELIALLRADGFGTEADRLYYLLHRMAWTTGSELIGELGQAMKRLEQERGSHLSKSTNKKMEEAFAMVRRVWPDFPR